MTAGARGRARPWSAREKLSALFFAGFVLAQVAVPVFQVTKSRPARFSWQMYSTVPLGALGEVFLVEGRSGAMDTIRITDHVVRGRWDVDYRHVLPPRLCDVAPGAVAILFEQAGTLLDRHECP